MSRPKLMLIDGMALAYRGHFVLINNPRRTASGLVTSAPFIFFNTLLDLLGREQPTHLAVALDTHHPTRRHREYPAYKASREAMPEELAVSLGYIDRLCEAFSIPVLRLPGYEADDIIGTLTLQADAAGFDSVMVTPDKDYVQLISDRTIMYKPAGRGAGYDILGLKEACEKWGVERIEQTIDVLGLMGDASDNVPGIPGIGEKTAQKLIARFGSMEGVFEHLDELKGKQRQNLEEFRAQGLLSKHLVTIDRDLPVPWNLDSLLRREADPRAAKAILAELEFRSIAKRLYGTDYELGDDLDGEAVPDAPATLSDTFHSYQCRQSPAELDELCAALQQQPRVCFDLETDCLQARHCEIVGIAFCWQAQQAFYVPFPEDESAARQLLRRFEPFFSNADIEKIGHNLKFDLGVLFGFGVRVAGALFDTMLAASLCLPAAARSMDALALELLRYKAQPISELIGPKGSGQGSLRQVPVPQVCEYAGEDADITWQLAEVLRERLAEQRLEKLFYQVEAPLVPVLVEMEAAGIRVDQQALLELSQLLEEQMQEDHARIIEIAGEDFNVASPKQLGTILFDKLQLSAYAKKTKTGQYKTDEAVLTRLAGQHEIAARILDYRLRAKLKSTYVDALPDSIDPITGRIHTHFEQAVTATGRMQSHDPNLQNIPIRSQQGREIRRAFVARDAEHLLLTADYSQIELRIAAHMSGDRNLRSVFAKGEDVHTATAATLYGVPLSQVDADMRRRAKTVNFSILFGVTPFGLSERMGISRGEGKDLIDAYFAAFPQLRAWMDDTIAFAREHGYVQTLIGRRRVIEGIDSRNGAVRQGAERLAINSPVQGAEADMIKAAMVQIHTALRQRQAKTQLILQVHDELVFDLHRDEREQLPQLIAEIMRTAMPLEVPIEVEIGMAENWLEAH